MENSKQEENNDQRQAGQSSTPTPIATSGEPELNTKNSTQPSQKSSLVGSAHTQLQLLVENVKVEIKELIQNGNTVDNKSEIDKITGIEKTERTGWRRYIGIIFALSASVIYPLCILIVKALPQYHPFSVTLWRFQGLLWPALPICFYCRIIQKDKIFDKILPVTAPGHRKTLLFLFLRGIIGACAITLQYYSLQYISVVDSAVVVFSTPVFVSLASHFLLGEKSGFIPIACGVITLCGVVLITRPPILTGEEQFDQDILIGAGLALGCMFCSVAVFLLLRSLREVHFSVILAYFGTWGSFQSLVLSTTFSKFQLPESFDHWMMVGALVILSFVTQSFTTLAFQYEQAGTVSLCRTCDILFAYLWQFVLLGEVPDLFSMLGGGTVILGISIAALRKYLIELPDSSQTRKRWWILLT